MQHSCLTLVSKPLIPHLPILYLLPLPPHHRLLLLAVLLRLLLPLPLDSLRVLQWNAGGLRARSTKLLHVLSTHSVDLICIQESNLNSSSSFRIPGFSAVRSDCPSAEEYSSLSSAAALFTSLALNAANSSISFGRIKRHPKVWWSAEVESTVSERRKAFAAAHRSDENRQAYISVSQRASSVIAKAKAEAWQTTCSSLSPRSNPKSVHSLLRSIAGSPSSSFSSPNFPNCSSPRESVLVYADYLRSHFFVSQPKALRSKARGYLSQLRRATCPEKSHLSFCSPFTPAEFLAAASNFSSSTATGPDKVAYPVLKHLPRSSMNFLLHIFNLSWSSHSFPSIWRTSSIIPIHKMGKPLDSSASFRPISLTSCASKLFERIILSHLLFFLGSNSILSLRQAGFHPGRSTLDQILYLSQSISDGFNKPRPDSRTILSTIDFSKTFDSVWHPALFHKLISAGFPSFFAR